MIRLGMMARETATMTIAAAIAEAKGLQLDAVDLHLSGMNREQDYLRHVRGECLRSGLTIGYGGGGSLVGPAEERGRRLAQGQADVDATAFLGAQVLRLFARHKWPDTVAEQEALWAPMIESFQELAAYAAARGVQLAVQNHNNGSFAMNTGQVLRILREVDRDNFTFLLDTGQWEGAIGSHPRGEWDSSVDLYEDYLKPTAAHATYVRAKIYKIDSGREEWLDYGRIVRILRDVDFNGTIGLVFELGDRNECTNEACRALAVQHLREMIAAAYS